MPPSKRLIEACEAASQAFKTYRHTSPEQRAVLENIADELDALGTDFLEIVSQETALPLARLQGERARTSGQMRLLKCCAVVIFRCPY